MEAILRALRSLVPVGAFLANVLTFLTTNWPLTVSTAVGLWAAFSNWALGWAGDLRVQTGVVVFLVLLWTYIGIVNLFDRRRPRVITPHQNYAYGLTYEGIGFGWDDNFPEATLMFQIAIRNFSPGPIRYKIENSNIVIARRTLGNLPINPMAWFIPRGGLRLYRSHPFPRDDVKELFGKRTTGTAEFSIIYGHPDQAPVRRLKMRLELALKFDQEKLVAIERQHSF